MKVIFLDVDGVLNSYVTIRETKEVPIIDGLFTVADSLIEKLATIVHTCNAKVVLSSTWRKFRYKKYDDNRINFYDLLETKLKDYAVEIYDVTEVSLDNKRAAEIQNWLNSHKNVESFVILDDEIYKVIPPLVKEAIAVDSYYGLTDKDVNEAIDILNNKG